jgi:plasmid stabilization system protein ParE
MSSVVFARSAQTDLLEVWSFIAEDSFEAADHVLDTIEKEAQTLALQPLMGRARSDLSVGIRSWPTSTSYNLYYLPTDSGITVIRVLHHARDIKSREFMN